MNIASILKEFKQQFVVHHNGVWENGEIIHPEYSPLTVENTESFLHEKLSALLDEIVEEMKGHNLIKNPNKNLDITKICYIEGYNEALGDVAAIVEAKK